MTSTASPVAPPADDDEIVTQILARRRRRLPLVTLVLGVAVAIGAGFVGGAYAQRHYGSTSSGSGSSGSLSALRSQFASRFGGRTTGGSGGTFSFGGAAPTVGTVTLIKGTDLYVTTSTGSTVIVHAGKATVSKSVTGTVKSILPGDAVSVTGTPGANGSTTARSISIQGGGNG
jgi:hypothetical protein